MALDYESLMSYFNYSILAILILGVIFGFFKGTFKSVYNLIVFVVLLLVGWFLSPVFSNMIINYDLSSYGLEVAGVELTTLGSFVNQMIINNVEGIEGALQEGSMLVELMNSFMVMVVRIIFIIVWLILMGTVFKFIFWIIYLIIKPKKKVEGKRRKKTLVSRLGGMGISLVHSLIVILMISIPLAGLSSIGSSLTTLVPNEDGNPTELSYRSVNVIYTPNGVLVDDSDIASDAILFMQNYRESLAGKISGLIKFEESYFDEAIFDEIISVKVNEKKIKLRYELQVAVNIYSTLMDELDGEELTLENIIKLDSSILDGIVDDLAKLKLIHVIIPIGLEVAINSDVLNEQLGDIKELVDLEELLEELKDLDYQEEISHLGKAVVSLLVLMDELEENEDGEVNLLALDPDKVEAVTNELSQSKMLDILGNVAISFVFNTEAVTEFLAEYGKTKDDIDLNDFAITNELVSLASIYRALNEAGFTTFDFEKLNLENITDEHINNIGTAVYSSNFFSKNTGLLADVIVSALPDEYKNILTVNNINKQDFISVLSLGVILAKSGLLSGEDFDPLNLLTEDNIEKIADYISKSDLLSGNVASLLEVLLESMELPIEIELPDDLIWKGAEGKAELIALFTTASKIVPMLDSENGFDFSKEKIDELSDLIVDSRILMHNMGNLLKFILSEAGLKDEINEESLDIDWDSEEGKEEFKELLNAVGIVLDSGLLEDPNFENLTDGSIDPEDDMIGDLAESMSKSNIIKSNLTPIISRFIPNDFEIELFDNPDDWTLTEIDSLLRSAKILLSRGDSFSIDTILELTKAEINIIVSSHIIINTAVKMLEDYTKPADENGPAGSLNGILFLPDLSNEEDPYYGVNGEMKKFILAAQIIIRENTSEGQGFEDLNKISIQSISGENQDTILESRILTETIISNIEKLSGESDLIKIHPDLDRSSANYVDGTWEDELPKLVDGILVFIGDEGSIDDFEFDTDLILDITDEDIEKVTASLLLSYTIVSYIESESENADSYISLPDDLNPKHASYNFDLWYGEDGELVKALKALRELGLADFTANIDLINIYSEAKGDVEDEVILASRVVEATIINKVETEAAEGGSLEGILIIPNDIVWGRNGTNRGELRNLIIAVEILIGNKPFEEAEFKVENIFNTEEHPNRQETLLNSRIVEESIIQTILKEAAPGGSLNGQLIVPEDINWYKTESDEGELRRFLAAVEIILDGKPLEEAEFKVENIFNSEEHPNRQETLLNSRIVEESIIQTIKTEAAPGGSLNGQLIVPEDINWYKTESDEGELRRFLAAIEIVLDGKPLDEAEFKVENIFNSEEHPNRQDTILDSRIVEASIINTIETEAAPGGSLYEALIIPSDINWYKTESDKGELRRFLDAIEILLDGKPLDEAEFMVEKMFNTEEHPDRQDTLLASRIMEASIVNTINNEMADGGSLHNTLVKPDEFDEEEWYGEDGELRRFLAAIEIIIGSNAFSTATFEVDKMLGDDQETILASRIVEASAIKFIKDEDKLVIPQPSQVGTFYYLSDEEIVWEKNGDDIGELRRFLAGVKALIGTGTFEDFEFTMDAIFEKDFSNVLPSRVLEATIAQTLDELVTTGVLVDFVRVPDNGYHWYFHETSAIDVRNGTFELTPTTYQYTDLLGLINAVKAMNDSGLSYSSITLANINATDSEELSDALWNHSRIIRGSIAKMLNTALSNAGIPYQFDENFFSSQAQVKAGLDIMKMFM